MMLSCVSEEQEAIHKAKQLIHISPKEAPKILENQIENYREEGRVGCALQARRYQCYAFMGNLDYRQAKASIERLFREAKDARESRFLGIGEMYLGIIATENGEIDVASECFDHAIRIAIEQEDLDLIRRVQVNLGYAQLMMERYDEALETLQMSVRHFEGEESDFSAAIAHKNIAFAKTHLAFHATIDGKPNERLLIEAKRSIDKSFETSREDFRLESLTKILYALYRGMESGPAAGLRELEEAKESIFQRAALSVTLAYLAAKCNLLELAEDWEALRGTAMTLLKHMRKYHSLAQFQTICRQAARANAKLGNFRTAYGLLDDCSRYLASMRSTAGLHGAYITNLRFDLEQRAFDEFVLRTRNRTLVEQNKALEREARLDPLSGVLNRRGIEEAMKEYVGQRWTTKLAIAILDIDLFKRINDEFGHAVGDRAIRAFAECLGASKTLPAKIGRWGGEEFVAIYDVMHETDLENLGETLIEEIRDYPWDRVQPGLRLTASCGLAKWNRGESIDEATKLADEMLYVVKENGRNGWCVAAQNDAA